MNWQRARESWPEPLAFQGPIQQLSANDSSEIKNHNYLEAPT
jgi:hypothetical protein